MLARESVLLMAVDLQEKLLPAIPAAAGVVEQTRKLLRFAHLLDLPVVWTEQYPKGLGPTVPEIASELEGHTPLEKTAFGCLGDEAIARAVRDTGRRQLLLAGVETHVCVMQTALAALASGFQVYVVRDAVASRTTLQYEAGLERMRDAGARLVTAEMAMFEILRCAGTDEFKATLPLVK